MSPEAAELFSKKQMLVAYGVVMASTIAGAIYLFYMIWKAKQQHRERQNNGK